MRILVVGAAGQLGQVMVARLARAHEVIGRASAELDITKGREVMHAVDAIAPEIIINCAAYNNVDGAEDEPVRALAVNAWGPMHLARAAEATGATFVHYSTDFVFDGKTSHPYEEDETPNPQGAYGVSKLLGEWLAARAPRAYVLRVESLFGGPRAKSSIDLLHRAILDGREARAFSDRVVSPSYVEDVATATIALLDREAPTGLYHCVNDGAATWIEVAQELARLSDRPGAAITPVRMADLQLKARRPLYAALSNAKLRRAGIALPTWQHALARYVRVAAERRD
jgi:dTDP-4-dehydrorhamnose reductase